MTTVSASVNKANMLELVPESDVVSIKKKKGRPRKNPIEEVCEIAPEKKKRGRKKKEKVEEEVKQKKKRGRKAALKFFSSTIRKKMPLTTVIYDNDISLLHLDIKDTEELDQTNITYDVLKTEYCGTMIEETNRRFDSDDNEDNKTNIINNKNESQLDNLSNLSLMSENDNDNDILCDYIENAQDDVNITDLYEKRLETRLLQDNQLIEKLDVLHQDDVLLSKLLHDLEKKTQISTNEKRNDTEDNKKKGFFKVLSEHIDTTSWSVKTNVACWWCCHAFNSVPIGLPTDYNKKKFRVHGIFCSFACLIAYKDNDHKLVTTTTNPMIYAMYRKLTGCIQTSSKEMLTNNIKQDCLTKGLFNENEQDLQEEYISSISSFIDTQLNPAPPRCTLKMFGGELSIEEFRNATKEKSIYKMIEYPMFVSRDYVEKVDLQNLKNVNKNVFNSQTTLPSNKLDDKKLEEVKNRVNSTVVVGQNNMDKFIKW